MGIFFNLAASSPALRDFCSVLECPLHYVSNTKKRSKPSESPIQIKRGRKLCLFPLRLRKKRQTNTKKHHLPPYTTQYARLFSTLHPQNSPEIREGRVVVSRKGKVKGKLRKSKSLTKWLHFCPKIRSMSLRVPVYDNPELFFFRQQKGVV